MGWEIAHDESNGRFIFICTTTGRAFGPYMSDNDKSVQDFYDWWNAVIIQDPRTMDVSELDNAHQKWQSLGVETKGIVMVPIEYKSDNATIVEVFIVHWECDGSFWKGKVDIRLTGVQDKEDPEVLHDIYDISGMELNPELEEAYYEGVPDLTATSDFEELFMKREVEDMEGNGQMNGSFTNSGRFDVTGGRPIHWKITEIENGWHSRFGGYIMREVGEDEYDPRYYD